jgi:class 3 adenylate cyclase
MMALGGFINGSAVILWSLICPLGALLFDKPARATYWLMACLALIIISGLVESGFNPGNQLTPGEISLFFVINLLGVGSLIYLMVAYFVRRKNFFQLRSTELLLNILPAAITRELSETGAVKPARFDDVTILFSDFKEFTNIVATIPVHKLVHELNEIFGRFDDIMEEEGVEKIQTIGDGYLAACGLPNPVADHALRCTRAAKKMIAFLDQRNEQNAIKWKIRIGIHSGPVVTGVVGKKKFAYTIFGDTINTASRLQTAGEEGRINVSAYTYDLIKGEFPGEYRGKIPAKGKGDLDMYFV